MHALRAQDDPPFDIEVGDLDVPLFAVAVHQGHNLRQEIGALASIDESTRYREEDPFSGVWAELSPNHMIARRSRFEVDLNRPPEKAVYINKDMSWGLDVWRTKLPREVVSRSLAVHESFYRSARDALSALTQRHRRVLVLDLHTYNHRRAGPNEAPADPKLNPEVNIGTGSLDRPPWASVVDAFIGGVRRARSGQEVDVRENVRFRGAYFAGWVHSNFPGRACALAVEIKKTFMDEWTGKVDDNQVIAWREILKAGTTAALGAL